jgi:glycosyltransferase involved in cell wall biosynthesis
MKKITYLVSQYPKLSQTFISKEIRGLRSRGVDINVASINSAESERDYFSEWEQNEIPNVYYVKSHGIAGALIAHARTLVNHPRKYFRSFIDVFKRSELGLDKFFYNLMYLTEALMVGEWMQRSGASHLHAHLGSQASTVGMYIKGVFGLGFSMTIHGPDEFHNVDCHYLNEKMQYCDFVVCISNFAQSQMMLHSPAECWDKLKVVRLGVLPEEYQPIVAERKSDVFEILCVGRLCPAKGQHILVHAVKQLHDKGLNVQVRFVGHGETELSLKLLVAQLGLNDRIIFEGAVGQERIRELYSNANVFSLPSFAEGIPIVLMEAMSMALPCVTTRITGIPELIDNGVDGLLVAASDVDELSDAIEQLYKDSSLGRRLGEAGRNKVLRKYNLAHNLDRLADLFRLKLT